MKIISFGYNKGRVNSDLVYDLRNLPRPDKNLRKYNGTDGRFIKEYFKIEDVNIVFNFIKTEIIEKEPMIIAIGCHEGKHRSVSFVEKLGRELNIEIEHKHLNKKRKERY